MIVHGIEIESDIELPLDDGSRWTEVALAMQPGQSALVPSSISPLGLLNAFAKLGYQAITEAEGTSGTRVWRRA